MLLRAGARGSNSLLYKLGCGSMESVLPHSMHFRDSIQGETSDFKLRSWSNICVWIYEELTDALEFSLEVFLVPAVGNVEEEVRVFALKKLRGWDGSTDTHHRSRAICSWLPSGQ